MTNCWTCKYLQLIEMEHGPYGNFTHVATETCPFMPDEMKCWQWGGRSELILLDTRTWEAWVDDCGPTDECSGYVKDE